MKKSLPHDAYEKLADSYASRIDTKPHNAYYERPAIRSLIPEVAGKTILDASCGPGVNTEWLLQKNALVVGIDASQSMIEHARARTAHRATFHLANLEEPLSFLDTGSFDGVVSALTVAYIENHAALFQEFNRVLRPGGWFVFSIEHPFFSYRYFGIEDYFTSQQVSCQWDGFDVAVTMPGYYHSLGSICNALTDNGFVIDKLLEPKPTEEFRQANPKEYDKLMQFPLFVCIRAKKIMDTENDLRKP
ncbi:MAG: class I SAM-dependent methyltransferase [Chitinivibrionales bacterium]|nr:class I SAM-dependent methyltransferase [Chitinivibrionales bacterium]